MDTIRWRKPFFSFRSEVVLRKRSIICCWGGSLAAHRAYEWSLHAVFADFLRETHRDLPRAAMRVFAAGIL